MVLDNPLFYYNCEHNGHNPDYVLHSNNSGTESIGLLHLPKQWFYGICTTQAACCMATIVGENPLFYYSCTKNGTHTTLAVCYIATHCFATVVLRNTTGLMVVVAKHYFVQLDSNYGSGESIILLQLPMEMPKGGSFPNLHCRTA